MGEFKCLAQGLMLFKQQSLSWIPDLLYSGLIGGGLQMPVDGYQDVSSACPTYGFAGHLSAWPWPERINSFGLIERGRGFPLLREQSSQAHNPPQCPGHTDRPVSLGMALCQAPSPTAGLLNQV